MKLYQRQPCEAAEQNEMKEAHEKIFFLEGCVFGIYIVLNFLTSSYFSVIFPSFIFDPFKTPSWILLFLYWSPQAATKRSTHRRRTGAARVSVILHIGYFPSHCEACLFFLAFLSVYCCLSFATSCNVLLPGVLLDSNSLSKRTFCCFFISG